MWPALNKHNLQRGTIRNTSNLQCISQMGQIVSGKTSRASYHAPALPEGEDGRPSIRPPPPMAVWADEQRSATKAIGARIEADVCGMRQALFVYIILPASTYRYLSASAYCVCVHYIPYNFKFYMV